MAALTRLALIVTLLLSGMAAHAAADPALERARIHLRAGMADYDEGRYAEAAAEMEQAYAQKPVPDLQYNLGQCYDRVGRLEDAAKAYEAYLAGKPGSPDADVVHKRIANLRARAQAQAEGKADPETAAPPPPKEKVIWRTLVVYRELPPPPGRAARAAAYGLFALGAAGLATGIAFAVLTTQASHDIETGGNVNSAPCFCGPQQATQAAARLYPIGTGVGFAVGALAAGGATGLYLYSRKVDREAKRALEREDLARVPTFAPYYVRTDRGTVGGVTIAGHF